MATIFGVTSLELTKEQETALSAALTKDLSTLYTHSLSFYLAKIPAEDARGGRGGSDQLLRLCASVYLH